ncbi:MAG: tetratricopeptide repeat protein [bacterium]
MPQNFKLSKRQIKEDKFTSFMLQGKGWFESNWQFVVIGVAAVILVAVAGTYYANSRTSKTHEAAVKFSRALGDYRNQNSQVASLSLQQVVDDYGDQEVAQQATFLLGKLNRTNRNYPEAQRFYELYLSKYAHDKTMRAACYAGIASCLEDQNQAAEAADKFDAAYREFPDGPLAGDYLNGAMRNHLSAGNIEAARANLDLIKEQFDGTNLASRATRAFVASTADKS